MSLVVPVTAEIQNIRHVKGRRGSSSNTSTESQFATKMYLYGREICFLLAIIFTSYAALQNSAAKVSKSPAAVPFFRGAVHVTDYYQGQLGRAFEGVSEADVSLVMYYAPWDADSQELRAHFSAAADYFHQQVHFVAINCWQPLSECRAHFSKIQTFPVLIAYVQGYKGVQFKGVRETAHIVAFLHQLLRPIERVHSTAHLVHMLSQHDAVLVGFFNFAGALGAPGFRAFHAASLRFLERDPRREIGFAVVTDFRTAQRWGVDGSLPSARLYLWNETLEYRGDMSAPGLVQWVSAALHQAVAWVAPPGVKSLTLAPYAEEGAVLVLFTPLNPLVAHDVNYMALREVALEYYNCDGNQWVIDLARWLPSIREESSLRHVAAERRCAAELRAAPLELPTVTLAASRLRDNGSCRRRDAPGPLLPCGPYHHMGIRALATSMLEGDDERGAAALTSAWQRSECARLSAARRLPRNVASGPSGAIAPPTSELRGLACRSNRTISLLAMDSLQFAHFAPALGVRLERAGDAAAVVFNAYEESSYAMAGPVDVASLSAFVLAHSEGRVTRTRRSSRVTGQSAPNRFPEVPSETCRLDDQSACIVELTSETFNEVVMDNSKSVVVLYHSPFCAFCSAVSHVFLTVARQFRAVPDLAFARVDGENNDLPWELTMHHYPTILFFPANGKSESRVFPRGLPVTSARLAAFLLANLGPGPARLSVRAGLCATIPEARAAAECAAKLRAIIVDAIQQALAQHRATQARWRYGQMVPVSRTALAAHRLLLRARERRLLFRLQHLREVQLLLDTADRLRPGSRVLAAVRKSFLLYRHALDGMERGETGERGRQAEDRDFADEDRSFRKENQDISERDQTQEDFAEGDRTFSKEQQDFVDEHRTFVKENQHFSQEERSFSKENDNFADKDQVDGGWVGLVNGVGTAEVVEFETEYEAEANDQAAQEKNVVSKAEQFVSSETKDRANRRGEL